jgi:hypothetical protein
MREALVGGGEVVSHELLDDVIMCYPAPPPSRETFHGEHALSVPDDVFHFTRCGQLSYPISHEVFITARTAEVAYLILHSFHT